MVREYGNDTMGGRDAYQRALFQGARLESVCYIGRSLALGKTERSEDGSQKGDFGVEEALMVLAIGCI